MRCGSNIVTGAVVPGTGYAMPSNDYIVQSPGKVVLFSPETPQGTIFSRSIAVPAGTAVLIDAYNMPVNHHIWVNRIVKSTTAPFTGDPCDPCAMNAAYGTEGVVVFRERMTLAGGLNSWALIKHDDDRCDVNTVLQLLIVIPGMYELELEDTTMLGDMEVEYMTWPMTLIPYMPKEYFAGIISHTCEL